jgi:G protein-coupled glucose receptor regulating Gpa2 C-term
MVLYPIAYVALSLPLPAGRLAVWSGAKVSLTFYCVGATLMTSCGFIDTILYTLTRRVLIREIDDAALSGAFSTVGRTVATHTVVVGDDGVAMTPGKRARKTQQGTFPSDSTEDIWNIVKTDSFEVRSDVVHQERASASSSREEYR